MTQNAALLAAALRGRERLPDGAAALYDFTRVNFVNWSEDLTNAAWARFNVTVTAAGQSVQGMTLARVEDTSTTARGDLSFPVSPVVVGDRVYVGLIVKADTSTYMAFRLTINGSSGGNPTCGVDLTTGAVTALGGGSPTAVARDLGGGFWEVVMSVTAREANRPNMLIMPAGLNASSFNTVSAAAPALGAVLVTAARMGYGPPAYERTTDSQVLLDRSGSGKHAALGNTAAADGMDPLWTSQGLSFDGTDDTVSLPVSGTRDTGTVLLAFRLTAVNGRLLAFGVGATTPRLTVYTDAGGNLIAEHADASGTRTTGPGVMAAGSTALVILRWNGAGFRVQLGSGPVWSAPSPIAGFTPTMFEIGNAFKALALQRGGAITAHHAALYDRELSDAEVARAVRVIRKQLAARSLTLS